MIIKYQYTKNNGWFFFYLWKWLNKHDINPFKFFQYAQNYDEGRGLLDCVAEGNYAGVIGHAFCWGNTPENFSFWQEKSSKFMNDFQFFKK